MLLPQAALLAELCGEEGGKPAAPAPPKAAKKSKKKKGGSGSGSKAGGKKGAVSAAASPAAAAEAGSEVVRRTVLAAVEEGSEEGEEEPGEAELCGSNGAEGAQPAAAQPEAAQQREGTGPAAEGPEAEAGSEGAARPDDSRPPSSGRSSLDADDERSPSPPGSPGGEWCRVGKPHQAHPRAASRPLAVPAAPAAQHQAGPAQRSSSRGPGGSSRQQSRGPRFEGASSLDSAAGRVRRCPSNGSLASTCSGESHDTDASRFSGSERSVLRAGSRQALAAAARHGPGPAKPAAGQAAGKTSGGSLLPPTAAWASQHAQQQQQQQQQPAFGPTSWAKVVEAKELAAPGGSSAAAPGQAAADAAEAAAPGACPQTAAAAPGHCEGDEELTALRLQFSALQRAQAESEFRHRQELAAVLEDAAQHEAAAVQQVPLGAGRSVCGREGGQQACVCPPVLEGRESGWCERAGP